jgi:transcription antitermination factor NusG
MLDAATTNRVTVASSAPGVQALAGICTSGAVAVPPRSPRWYAVLTRSGQESRAAEELRRQGFAVFCPMVAKPYTPRDRRSIIAAIARASGKRVRGRPPKFPVPAPKVQTVPALRGYVFVHVDLLADDCSTIRSTRGVCSSEERSVFLCMRLGEPYPIQARQIEAMQGAVMELGAHADLVRALMKAGEVVRVADGPFSSFPGTVLKQEGDDIWLHVEMFGRTTPVQLKVGQVERVA